MRYQWIVTHAVNSVLSFWCAIALIELLFWLFRMRVRRVRYLIRLIPMVKLPWDLWRGGLWTGWYGLNPALAEAGSRAVSIIAGFTWPFPTLKVEMALEGGYRFGWADLLNGCDLFFAIAAFSIVVVAIWKLMALALGWRTTYSLLRDLRVISLGRGIWLSPDVDCPCATPGGRILLPSACLALPADELVAIVAHERSHVRWKDGWIDSSLGVIRALFWFVPGAGWWCRKIEFDRECACDQVVGNRHAMGRAIARVAQWPGRAPVMGLIQGRSKAVSRLEALLEGRVKPSHWLLAVGVLYLAGIVFWSQLWLL
jgi:BlaR1 peptidase M56